MPIFLSSPKRIRSSVAGGLPMPGRSDAGLAKRRAGFPG
jgi:hypothetical protein